MAKNIDGKVERIKINDLKKFSGMLVDYKDYIREMQTDKKGCYVETERYKRLRINRRGEMITVFYPHNGVRKFIID